MESSVGAKLDSSPKALLKTLSFTEMPNYYSV
jgi:hypothetical protein